MCHQPHKAPSTVGFLTYFAPDTALSSDLPDLWLSTYFDIVCTHLCFNKDAKTVVNHMFLSLRPPPFTTSYSLLHLFRRVHLPGDIWISTADHYMVTARVFMILWREVATNSHKMTDIQGAALL